MIESRILVATRSHTYPPVDIEHSFENLGLENQPTVPPAKDWETWGEGDTIEICEVAFVLDSYALRKTLVTLIL